MIFSDRPINPLLNVRLSKRAIQTDFAANKKFAMRNLCQHLCPWKGALNKIVKDARPQQRNVEIKKSARLICPASNANANDAKRRAVEKWMSRN